MGTARGLGAGTADAPPDVPLTDRAHAPAAPLSDGGAGAPRPVRRGHRRRPRPADGARRRPRDRPSLARRRRAALARPRRRLRPRAGPRRRLGDATRRPTAPAEVDALVARASGAPGRPATMRRADRDPSASSPTSAGTSSTGGPSHGPGAAWRGREVAAPAEPVDDPVEVPLAQPIPLRVREARPAAVLVAGRPAARPRRRVAAGRSSPSSRRTRLHQMSRLR